MLEVLLKHAALNVDIVPAHMVRRCCHHIQQLLARVYFQEFGFSTLQRMTVARQLDMGYQLGLALGYFGMRLEALSAPLAQLVP